MKDQVAVLTAGQKALTKRVAKLEEALGVAFALINLLSVVMTLPEDSPRGRAVKRSQREIVKRSTRRRKS